MARPRSAHVIEVKAALAARLRSGFAAPGGRFLSARAVAQRFAVSYQTAHRLLAELEQEDLLRRKPASGSYLPGRPLALRGVQLVLHARAKRKGSFGARLHELLEAELAARDIAVARSWPKAGGAPAMRADHFPVIWECRRAVEAAVRARRFALCLNERPPPGLGSGYVDAVTTDDFSGGACAAELLKERTDRSKGFVVLGGPEDDARCLQRVAGFRAHAADTRVIHAESWYVEAGIARAQAILDLDPLGIFACNDRLAQAVIEFHRARGRKLPPLVGFDNAPIAERLRLTTIGIPWSEMVKHAAERIVARLQGSTAAGRLTVLTHEPVVRLTC
ncbi:MAG: substrate-binding domain-containing protein [Opitutaceae bacterium]